MNQIICENRDELLGQVANEFFEAVARGESPSINDYAARYPDIADDIQRVFLALALVGDPTATNTHRASASNGASVMRGSPDPAHSADSHVARVLGDFRILRELGRGGMGMVYEAEQLSMGRNVALKVLPFAAIAQEKSLQRFRNEVRAAAALDHPNIVSVYSIGEERGVHFYAMQLVRGRTLADVIAELRTAVSAKSPPDAGEAPTINSAVVSPSSTKRDAEALISTAVDSRRDAESYRAATRLGIQAAEALQHAHDLGVLHRDIKPSNLMLDLGGKLYVTDFGLARIEADAGMTMTGDILGTLRYMAPEQALAKRVVIDHRADIYSLGATLYELLTLQPAFDETDRSELLKQIAFEEPPPLRKINARIPAEVETIVLKAIAKEPDERYQTAQLLADDLQAYLEHRPITARSASFVDRLRKWSRRREKLVRASRKAGRMKCRRF
jgi:serine/threonine protein kinase